MADFSGLPVQMIPGVSDYLPLAERQTVSNLSKGLRSIQQVCPVHCYAKRSGTKCDIVDSGSTDKCCCYPIGVIAYIVLLFGLEKISDEKRAKLPDVVQLVLKKVRNVRVVKDDVKLTIGDEIVSTLDHFQFNIGEITYRYVVSYFSASSVKLFADNQGVDYLTISDVLDIVHISSLLEKTVSKPVNIMFMVTYKPIINDALQTMFSDMKSSLIRFIQVKYSVNDTGLDIPNLIKRIPERDPLAVSFIRTDEEEFESFPPSMIMHALREKQIGFIIIDISDTGLLTVDSLNQFMDSVKNGRFVITSNTARSNSRMHISRIHIDMEMDRSNWHSQQCWMPFVDFHPNSNSAFVYVRRFEVTWKDKMRTVTDTKKIIVIHTLDGNWVTEQTISMRSIWNEDVNDFKYFVQYEHIVTNIPRKLTGNIMRAPHNIVTNRKIVCAADMSNDRLAHIVNHIIEDSGVSDIDIVDVFGANTFDDTVLPSNLAQGGCTVS